MSSIPTISAAIFINAIIANQFSEVIYHFVSPNNPEKIALVYRNTQTGLVHIVNGYTKKTSGLCRNRLYHMAKGVLRQQGVIDVKVNVPVAKSLVAEILKKINS